jgi:DNA-binding response OmpR family regulator
MAKPDAKKILIAEDDAGVQRIITMTLEKAGFQVISAKDGVEAHEKALNLLPDAIVLDVGLPKMDGLTVCKKLRTVPSTARIPVGFLTAQTGSETYQEAMKAGSLLYMPKPFKPERLVSFVHILLASPKKEHRT